LAASSPFDLASVAARLAPTRASARAPYAGTGHDGGSKHAAVAAILREGREGAEVLLIRRAERASDPWSGHMAFPGGRKDQADPDLYTTAVRETREEVGIDLAAHGTLLGRLEDLEAIARARRTGLMIAPFVFSLAGDVPLTFDPDEVAEALWVALAPLARNEGAGTVRYERDGVPIDLPCWDVQGRVVWGLTYRMIQTLFEALAP
jgi:8-oxo-dGTP pyrophosphatase MutT (NUDIX family)